MLIAIGALFGIQVVKICTFELESVMGGGGGGGGWFFFFFFFFLANCLQLLFSSVALYRAFLWPTKTLCHDSMDSRFYS